MTKLVAETDAIGAAAKSGNLDAVKAQWLKVAEACGACHGGPAKSGGKFRFEEPVVKSGALAACFSIAAQIRCGVAGMSMCRTP